MPEWGTVQVARGIDFVATLGGKRVYIQSAYALQDEAKAETEKKPFALTGDSFPKMIVRHDIRKRWYNDIEDLGYMKTTEGKAAMKGRGHR